jgi:2-dehydropantoate 2-reductase
VVVCGRTPRDSIEVRSDDGNSFVVPGPVRTDPETITEPVDVVLLAVKDTQTPAAAAWLARLCDESTTVLALQNGVEQFERVGRYCQGSTVLPAVVWFSVETQPQGWVRLRTPVALVLPDTPATDRLAETLRGPRLSIDTDPDFVTAA